MKRACILPLLAVCWSSFAEAQVPAPAVAPNWAGFYLGAHLGGASVEQSNPIFSDNNSPTVGIAPGFATVAVPANWSLGAVGGVHGGYNWQLAPTWVVGIEGDWSATSLSQSGITGPLVNNLGATQSARTKAELSSTVNWLASVRGRLGWTFDRALLFATGGVAWADVDYHGVHFANGTFGNTVKVNQTLSGWVVGGGIEYMTASPWLLRAEYLYYSLDGGVRATALYTPAIAGDLGQNFQWQDLNIHVVRLGLTYKF